MCRVIKVKKANKIIINYAFMINVKGNSVFLQNVYVHSEKGVYAYVFLLIHMCSIFLEFYWILLISSDLKGYILFT